MLSTEKKIFQQTSYALLIKQNFKTNIYIRNKQQSCEQFLIITYAMRKVL